MLFRQVGVEDDNLNDMAVAIDAYLKYGEPPVMTKRVAVGQRWCCDQHGGGDFLRQALGCRSRHDSAFHWWGEMPDFTAGDSSCRCHRGMQDGRVAVRSCSSKDNLQFCPVPLTVSRWAC